MRVKLVLIGDRGERTVYRLKKVPTVIGRGRDADLTLAHPLASRHHCELYEVEGTLCVRDLGSLNGTFVGDFRVTEAALESGDILTIGGARFEVVVDKEAEPLMPPPAAVSGPAAPKQEADVTEPVMFEPEVLESEIMEPEVAAPDLVEPDVVEPDVIEPEIIEPEFAAQPKPDEPEELDELDFADVDPAQATPAASAKPETKPAKPAKPPGPQAKTQPVSKSTPKDAKAAPKDDAAPSQINLAGLGEDEPKHVSTDDSGLNSFLRKL
jgi:predicted component of type VI protein secretion system